MSEAGRTAGRWRGAALTGTWFATGAAMLAVLGLIGAAWVAGWQLQSVTTGSMQPAVPADALAVVAPVAPRDVAVGDVIAFHERGNPQRTILHRVIEIESGAGSALRFRTQGDANGVPDAHRVEARHLVGAKRWHIPRLGPVTEALQPPWGLVVLGGAPLAIGLALGWRQQRRENALRPRSPVNQVVEWPRPVIVDGALRSCSAAAPGPATNPVATAEPAAWNGSRPIVLRIQSLSGTGSR